MNHIYYKDSTNIGVPAISTESTIQPNVGGLIEIGDDEYVEILSVMFFDANCYFLVAPTL